MKNYRRIICQEKPRQTLYRDERLRWAQHIIAESHKSDHWKENQHNAGKTYYLESVIKDITPSGKEKLTYCWTLDEENAYIFCPAEGAIDFVEKHFTGKDEKTISHLLDCTGDWREEETK